MIELLLEALVGVSELLCIIANREWQGIEPLVAQSRSTRDVSERQNLPFLARERDKHFYFGPHTSSIPFPRPMDGTPTNTGFTDLIRVHKQVNN